MNTIEELGLDDLSTHEGGWRNLYLFTTGSYVAKTVWPTEKDALENMSPALAEDWKDYKAGTRLPISTYIKADGVSVRGFKWKNFLTSFPIPVKS